MSTYRLSQKAFIGFVFLLVFLPTQGYAQVAATTGIIRGTISDPLGNRVRDARVAARHQGTGLERNTVTNERGVFVLPLLPPGVYDLSVEASPFPAGITREDVTVRFGESVDLDLLFEILEIEGIRVSLAGTTPLIDRAEVTSLTRLSEDVFDGLPNNGRNFLELVRLTPGVGVAHTPGGDDLNINGQRAIFNNISVDGADFNNPFFGRNRGGTLAAFTFNQDAIEEMVVTNQGATAEYGRSTGGFINVVTKSGTNQLSGTAHYFGQFEELSADLARGGGNPAFTQGQFGFTLGGPLKRDKAFFFIAYDQQNFTQTKQNPRVIQDPASLERLQTFLATEYGTAFDDDFGPISRTDDARALIAKIDFRPTATTNVSLKYNYAWAELVNGSFDVDPWSRSANVTNRLLSHSVNGSLHSQLSPNVFNEVRFQFSRERQPWPYEGPTFPGTERHFPDSGADFIDGFRWGMPWFAPLNSVFDRIQVLNNTTTSLGEHLIKFGVEWNRAASTQTFTGFGNGRYIFSSTDGFIDYVEQGPTFVECSDGSSNVTGACPVGTTIRGPLLSFTQFAPVRAGDSVEDAGTQTLVQNELAAYVQDSWRPHHNVTLNYGLRWEALIQPDVITPASEVFFEPFIGQPDFPSDGTIKSHWLNLQPRFGLIWDVGGSGSRVLRVNAGIYYPHLPALTLASIRSTNGSIGQTITRSSASNANGVTPPPYDQLLNTAGSTPIRPDIFVVDKDFELPRSFSATLAYEQMVASGVAAGLSYQFARTDNLFRFVNRNDAVFGSPFSDFPNDPSNGLGVVNTMESTAHSIYHALTGSLRGRVGDRVEFGANYTISSDRSDDDNERSVFSFQYAQSDRLGDEWGVSTRHRLHRGNVWFLSELPGRVMLNNRISAYSASPTSEACGAGNIGTGERAARPSGRICPDGSILERNTLRKDDAFFTWDARLSRPFQMGGGGLVEVIIEAFNILNIDNFTDPSAFSALFNFDAVLRNGLGDPFRLQVGARWAFGG